MFIDPLARWIDPKQAQYYIDPNKQIAYVVGPEPVHGDGHYVGSPQGWKFDLNKFASNFMGKNIFGPVTYEKFFANDELLSAREFVISFENYMDRLNQEASESKTLGFIYNESKTQSKGIQAYLYAFPIPAAFVDGYKKVDTNGFALANPILSDYMKWHSDSSQNLAKGKWGVAGTPTLKIQELVTEKKFRFLTTAQVVEILGEAAVVQIYRWFRVDDAQVRSRPKSRFNSLI